MERIDISIMGEAVRVPPSLTILQAFEFAGHRMVRGVGCRGGFCGACATVFRRRGDPTLRFGLACQTVVEEGMVLTLLPFYPGHRPGYRLEELEPSADQVLELYPELVRCYGCNTCTKSCPQGIDVLAAVSAVLRGDLRRAADLSFECIACGLCASRCPAELVKHDVLLLCRRLCGRHLAPVSKHLRDADEAVRCGAARPALEEIKALDTAELRERYRSRDIEPS